MSDYSQITFFTPKDSLSTGNPNKIIYGSDVDAEFSAISTAIATKADVDGDAIGAGTPATEINVDNLKLDGNKITSTNTDGDIELEPNGTGTVVITNVDVAAGEIDGTAIGANSASTGAFTTLTATGLTSRGTNNLESTSSQQLILERVGSSTGSGYLGADVSQACGIWATDGTTKVATFYQNADFALFEDTGTTPKFFWDASAERLGLGTTSPAELLDVNGHINLADGYELKWGGAGATIYGSNSNNQLRLYTNNTERMRIDSSGNVGIGTSPSGKLHVRNTTDTYLRLDGATSGGNYGVGVQYYKNGTEQAFAGVPYNFSNTFVINTGGSERARIDASGNLLVGTTNNASSANLVVGGGTFAVQTSGNGNRNMLVAQVSNENFNGANTAVYVGRNGTTSRSINAGGTVNASGADYAEYMTKAGDFSIAKGDVCGVNADGKLTNVYADAIAFVVKSTDPSYVGGDRWGDGLDGDALEQARKRVDRIAFSGQVPVNVLGATPGDYIVPQQEGEGIIGVAVSSPTFEQYMTAVGKVIAIEDDGRARIIVKVS